MELYDAMRNQKWYYVLHQLLLVHLLQKLPFICESEKGATDVANERILTWTGEQHQHEEEMK